VTFFNGHVREDFKSELLLVLGPVAEPFQGIEYRDCSWVLSEVGLGISANPALNDYTERLT
jgi:hypothetical protein